MRWKSKESCYRCKFCLSSLQSCYVAHRSIRPQIAEAAVVGVLSEQWGQKVAAVVVLHPEQVHTGRGGKVWGVMDMRRALKDRLANYKIPQEMKVLPDGIPRNSMGKGEWDPICGELLWLRGLSGLMWGV